MGAMGIFNGEVVKLKLRLNLLQGLLAGFVQPDPYKPMRVGKVLADVCNRNRCDSAAVAVRSAIDDSFDVGSHSAITFRSKNGVVALFTHFCREFHTIASSSKGKNG